MYLFTIKYLHERYHTGQLKYNSVRTAKVFAKTTDEAILKIKSVDDSFICITDNGVTFEELLTPNGAEN